MVRLNGHLKMTVAVDWTVKSQTKQNQMSSYSPVAIIRKAKIRNIILLHAFFRTLSSNLDSEYPAVSEENCLKNLLPLP